MDSESFAAAWVPEDAAFAAARARADEAGLVAVSPLAGATLRLLATAVGARAAVEVGTGTGVSTLWLVRGMRPGGVLTSLDTEAEHHRLARLAISDAEVPASRVRLITGRAEDVVPRLSEAAYDLVHLDVPLAVALDLLPQALRVLRPGGIVAVSRALAGGRIGTDAARDPEAVAARALARAVSDDDALTPLLLPLPGATDRKDRTDRDPGDGLLVAVKTVTE